MKALEAEYDSMQVAQPLPASNVTLAASYATWETYCCPSFILQKTKAQRVQFKAHVQNLALQLADHILPTDLFMPRPGQAASRRLRTI